MMGVGGAWSIGLDGWWLGGGGDPGSPGRPGCLGGAGRGRLGVVGIDGALSGPGRPG